jgi:hypothetical protein
VTCDGTVTGFALANPKLAGEREQARAMLQRQPANRPAPGTAVVTDKGLTGEDIEAFFAGPDLSLALTRPARKDEKPRPFPNWLRQRVEAIIWTLNHHRARVDQPLHTQGDQASRPPRLTMRQHKSRPAGRSRRGKLPACHAQCGCSITLS